MTMSFIGADDSGFGIVIASSSPAVAARCAHLRSGVGVVATQNITDPRLGPALLDAMERGLSPEAAISSIVQASEHIQFRQLTVLDATGRAHFTGDRGLGVISVVRGEHVVGAGNMLANRAVIEVAVQAFERSEDELENRLMNAMKVAVTHGGEEGPLHSAGLMTRSSERTATSGAGWLPC